MVLGPCRPISLMIWRTVVFTVGVFRQLASMVLIWLRMLRLLTFLMMLCMLLGCSSGFPPSGQEAPPSKRMATMGYIL